MTLLQVGDSAPEVILPDDLGKPVKLSDLWTQRPIAVVFVRHTG